MSIVPLTNSTNSLTEVPSDLDSLPKDELVNLLKRVTAERDEQARKKQKTAPMASSAPMPAFDVVTMKKRITKDATRVIKKTAHNRQKKPWTEIFEVLPPISVNPAAVHDLMAGYRVQSDTARMMKWELTDAGIVQWLGCDPYIHPVKFDGKVWCFAGAPPPSVYAWAGFEKCQVKYEKKSGRLTLKFRTYMAGSGMPQPGVSGPPHLFT